jgi:chromosome segregation ATPase
MRLGDWQPDDEQDFFIQIFGDMYMRKPTMTPDALPHRGKASSSRIAAGLVLVAGASAVLWSVGTHNLSFASAASVTTEDRIAALTAELAQVRRETAVLREIQGESSEEFAHIRAGLANAEISLARLRTTTDENEARRRDTTAQIESNLDQLKSETLRLRMAQDDTTAEMGSLRAGVANSEIGLDSLRTSTGDIRLQVARIEAVTEATSSIARGHRRHHRKWLAQR